MTPDRKSKEEIQAAIDSFQQWHYRFDLHGCITPIHKTEWTNRHNQREKYFFDPLTNYCGGTLKGKRVLDIGCNAGYWALKAIEKQCDFVMGIDARDMHIQQAELVFNTLEIETSRYRFIKADVFDIDFHRSGPFDIVLFLGLMYHISKPIELMEKIAAINSDFLVIDTFLSGAEGSVLEIGFEKTNDPRLAADREIVFRPTKQAVFDIVRQFGYNVFMLEPHFTDYTGSEVYRDGRRRAFMCAKQTDLRRFPNPAALGSKKHPEKTTEKQPDKN